MRLRNKQLGQLAPLDRSSPLYTLRVSVSVRSGDVANAIQGFEFGPGFVSAAGLDGNWRLTNSGEGDQGSVSLHVASSVSCLSDQVLTELKSVN